MKDIDKLVETFLKRGDFCPASLFSSGGNSLDFHGFFGLLEIIKGLNEIKAFSKNVRFAWIKPCFVIANITHQTERSGG